MWLASIRCAPSDDQNSLEDLGMEGEIGSLAYVIMDVLSLSKDPEAIPVIRQMLADKNERVVLSSYYALIKLGKSDAELQMQIENVAFPESAVKIFKSWGVKTPEWVKTRQ